MNAPATADACLYSARVMHRRHVPPYYRFVYRVFYLFVDIDQLDALSERLRWFSYKRFNLLSLHEADHGDGLGLRRWAQQTLRDYGLAFPLGRVRLLCLPRVLGMAFNPISFWYCEHEQGGLRAVIAEVHNTFGERHSYVLASSGAPLPYGLMPEKEKCFHVSPFFDLQGRYRFVLQEPAAYLRVAIHETRDQAPLMDATLAGERLGLCDGEILRQVLAMPLLMLKVLAAIHWQALKLWWRGARFHRKPVPPAARAS